VPIMRQINPFHQRIFPGPRLSSPSCRTTHFRLLATHSTYSQLPTIRRGRLFIRIPRTRLAVMTGTDLSRPPCVHYCVHSNTPLETMRSHTNQCEKKFSRRRLKTSVFWCVTPCGLVETYRRPLYEHTRDSRSCESW
jgi:hypothetical protein